MIIKDKMTRFEAFGRSKFPMLKGHVKLTLRNVHNGKTEVIEGENIVTNAVADMMALNYFGAIDYSKIWGANGLWKKWFGGVLAYGSAHPNLDADKYFPQAESDNHLIAHAGQSAIDVEHDDDLRRGNPTPSSFVATDSSMKQVWEWGTTHGNGTIRALSLCHSDVGDAGLGSTHYAFQNFSPFEQIQNSNLPSVLISATSINNISGQYDDNHCFFFHHGEESDFQLGTVYYNTNKLTVHVRRFPFSKVGLFETYTPTTRERVFTVTMPFSTYFLPAYHFDYANKLLWIFNNTTDIGQYSTTTVNYCVIDCESEEITTSGTIVSDTENLPPLCCSSGNGNYYDQCRYDYAQILKDGNYIYLPTGTVGRWTTGDAPIVTVNGYKKINLSNQSEQSSITFNTGRTVYRSVIKDGGLLVQSGTVVNGDVGYDCVDQFPSYSESDAYYGWEFASPHRQVTYASPRGTGFREATVATYILANKLLNTTKYNLPSAITKTASQSMTVEYTLTEV